MDKTEFETNLEEAATKAGGLLRSRFGIWFLALVSFAESALLAPIVTDPFLSAYILADRKSAVKGVIVTVITSALGGMAAYAMASLFYDFVEAKYLVGTVGEQFSAIAAEFQKGTFIITILGAVTPIPYTVVALAAGFVKGNFLMFILATIVGRTFRYGVVAWLTYHFGHQALAIARRHLLKVTVVSLILAALYFFLFH